MQGSYTNLNAWTESYDLALRVYRCTASFPSAEKYGLTSQMQRAGTSIPCNVAEGYARISQKEKVQFYSIARGSVAELQTQLRLAKDLQYITSDTFDSLLGSSTLVYKLLNGLIKAVQAKL
jgi:four helix bundle protein